LKVGLMRPGGVTQDSQISRVIQDTLAKLMGFANFGASLKLNPSLTRQVIDSNPTSIAE
jgi:hypothetical protein